MEIQIDEELRKDFFYIGVVLLVVVAVAGVNNLMQPDSSKNVGLVETHTVCHGVDVGVCIGLQEQDYTVHNYDEYEKAEPGTEDFYRRVEAELMAKAYNTCNNEMEGFEWTSEVEYRNKTGEEWRQNDNVELFPCEKTFYRDLTQSN